MLIYAITRGTLLRGVAVFLFGVILGATCAMLYSARLIDNTLIELETLRSELADSRSRNARLEQSLEDRRTRVVQDISINLDVTDRHLSLRLSQVARELIDDLIGQEIGSLDAPLIASVFSGRTVTVEGASYTFDLDLLVISETLELYLSVIPGAEEFPE